MSEKRNYSSIVLSPSSDSSTTNLISEPLRKRWKSQQDNISIETNSTKRCISFSNGTAASATITGTMMETNEGDINKSINVITSENENGSESNSISTNDQKQIRYDRQLRLWGDHGQLMLESAHVCLLNATVTGTEILKSLILPGVGAFTIIDGETISGADVGSNFFMDDSSIGKGRAEVACGLLQELNSDVRGNFVASSIEKLLSQQDGLSMFDQFTVVIGTNLKHQTISAIGDYLYPRGVPFLICQSYGLIGYVRLLVKEHPIIESHPDNPLPNFMLDRPFPGLIQLVESIDLNSLNHKDHSHTPYLILLCKALEKWRQEKNVGDAYPKTYKEKKELKEILLSMRQPDDKGSLDEENFQEAINSVNTALNETTIPRSVNEILNDEAAQNLTPTSSKFWILCHALRRFVDDYGRLPVRGSLPDMISDSERYIRLQNIYLRQANEDASIVHSYATETAKLFERTIPISETRLFCKNASFLRLIRSTSSLNDDGIKNENFITELKNEENLNALWYLVLRTCDEFVDHHGRYPCSIEIGQSNDENDKNDLFSRVDQKIKELLVDEKEKATKLKNAVDEVCRYGGTELHAVASYMGGVVAQEVIKLITHQYVPLDNTYVFDGNTGQGSVFSF